MGSLATLVGTEHVMKPIFLRKIDDACPFPLRSTVKLKITWPASSRRKTEDHKTFLKFTGGTRRNSRTRIGKRDAGVSESYTWKTRLIIHTLGTYLL